MTAPFLLTTLFALAWMALWCLTMIEVIAGATSFQRTRRAFLVGQLILTLAAGMVIVAVMA